MAKIANLGVLEIGHVFRILGQQKSTPKRSTKVYSCGVGIFTEANLLEENLHDYSNTSSGRIQCIEKILIWEVTICVEICNW